MMVQWSHSALKDFETCARKYHELRVLKHYPREETEQTKYGELLHEAAEKYVAHAQPLPEAFLFLKEPLDALMQTKQGVRHTEFKMALRATLDPCDWKDGLAWVRGIADLLILDDDGKTAWVVDYKSGSDKYPDKDQLVLMSLMVFQHFPQVENVYSALMFVVRNTMLKHKVRRSETEMLWWKYRERVSRIEECHAADVWNPKQSGLCRKHCPVLTCEFNGRS